MAVNCYLTLNGVTLAAQLTLPIKYESVLIRSQQRAINGQLMTAHRAEKLKTTLEFVSLSEAQRTSVIGAAAVAAAVTFVDEAGTSRTVVVQSVKRDLVRTEPASPGSTSTTGPGYYDMTIEIEEV